PPGGAARSPPSSASSASRCARAAPCWRCGCGSTCRRSDRSASRSPTGLGHAGDLSLVRELAQADPAEAELAVDGARAPAAAAAGVAPHLEPRRLRLLVDEWLLGHCLGFPSVLGEREPE